MARTVTDSKPPPQTRDNITLLNEIYKCFACFKDTEDSLVVPRSVHTDLQGGERTVLGQGFLLGTCPEFLAALHTYLTIINCGVNLLSEEESTTQKSTHINDEF